MTPFTRRRALTVLSLAAAAVLLGCGSHQHSYSGATRSSDESFPDLDTAPAGSRIFNLDVYDANIELVITPGALNVSDASIQAWVRQSARAVGHYFGRFPVRKVRIEVLAAEVGPIGDGVTTDAGIRVTVGPVARQPDLDNDWILVHEMFHLAFPDMDERYIWLREGLASYLEPFARARVGTIAVDQVWMDLYDGLPQGQPQAGDQGLNQTHTRERTYWGGSLFCLLADLRIREQTGNRRSLDDAMRAVLDQGGTRYQHWAMQQVIDVCDQATGTTVVRDLYREMAMKPVVVDLNSLWARLGVDVRDGRVIYDNAAPLAKIRVTMTARASRAAMP